MPNLITCIINFLKWLSLLYSYSLPTQEKNPYTMSVDSPIWYFDGQGCIELCLISILIKITSGLGDIILLMNSECLGTTHTFLVVHNKAPQSIIISMSYK